MRSIDTNVLARFVLRDHPAQSAIADQLLATRCWIGITVTLELWWVLTTVGRYSAVGAAEALTAIAAIDNVVMAHDEAVTWAASRAAQGADFADMLHLALSGGADAFSTFDKGIAAHADGAPVPVETL